VVSVPTDDTSAHPGPEVVSLPAEIRQAMIDHARAEYPNEMCGVIVGDRYAAAGGGALRWEPARNEAASPMRYVVHRDDIYRLTVETDDADQVFWGIAHSHVRSQAVPSPTDIGAAQYPEALYVLVSLDPAHADTETGEPGVRAWRIVGGRVHEVALTS
jgi:[CysO sulfur-carrier protein]-S-L-cysteine hydrolase